MSTASSDSSRKRQALEVANDTDTCQDSPLISSSSASASPSTSSSSTSSSVASSSSSTSPPSLTVTFEQMRQLIDKDPSFCDRLQREFTEKCRISTLPTHAPASHPSGTYMVYVTSNEPQADVWVNKIRECGAPAKRESSSTMVIGDFWLVTKQRKIAMVVERKRVDDLVASIKNHRLYDEVDRMMKSKVPRLRVLVVGSLKWLNDTEDRMRAHSAISRLNWIDKRLQVSFVDEDADVPQWLASEWRYASNYFEGHEWFEVVPEIEETKRLCKKREITTQEDAFFVQLCVNHMLTPRHAKVICANYPSWGHLLHAYDQLDSEPARQKMLANLPIPSKKGAETKRLGPALSTRVYQTTVLARSGGGGAATAAAASSATH